MNLINHMFYERRRVLGLIIIITLTVLLISFLEVQKQSISEKEYLDRYHDYCVIIPPEASHHSITEILADSEEEIESTSVVQGKKVIVYNSSCFHSFLPQARLVKHVTSVGDRTHFAYTSKHDEEVYLLYLGDTLHEISVFNSYLDQFVQIKGNIVVVKKMTL